jgi:integrase
MKVQAGELIRLLEGGVRDGTVQIDERLQRWAEAFEAWLEMRRTQFSRNVGVDSYNAWKEFLAFTRKAPWEVQAEDMEAFIEALEDKGLSVGTIQNRLTGLNQFYKYCQVNAIDEQSGDIFNPVAGVRRPRVKMYEKANYLSREEEKALLEVIRNDPSVIGKRDYALILLLLRTGCMAGEARRLRWGGPSSRSCARDASSPSGLHSGQGEQRSEGAGVWESPSTADFVLRSGQGLEEEVWEAIVDYLKAAGRMGRMQAGEYVFAPSRAPLDQMHHMVKVYAGWAGLNPDEITCHTLRHTAVMRWVEAGMCTEEVQKRLGRASRQKTEEYIRRLKEIPRRRSKPAREDFQTPSRGPCRTKPGNLLALRHGLRAKRLPEMEWLEEKGVRLKGFDRELVRLRVIIGRALILYEEAVTNEEKIHLLLAASTAGMRVGRLLKKRHDLREMVKNVELDEETLKDLREWGLI